MALENSVRKGQNAGNQHFLLFPQCLLLYQREKLSFQQRQIFFSIKVRNCHFSNVKFIVCKCFQFGPKFCLMVQCYRRLNASVMPNTKQVFKIIMDNNFLFYFSSKWLDLEVKQSFDKPKIGLKLKACTHPDCCRWTLIADR